MKLVQEPVIIFLSVYLLEFENKKVEGCLKTIKVENHKLTDFKNQKTCLLELHFGQSRIIHSSGVESRVINRWVLPVDFFEVDFFEFEETNCLRFDVDKTFFPIIFMVFSRLFRCSP